MKREQIRKAVVILGMHRSGTSALSQLLMRLGGDSPATLLGPTPDNPKGHFESRPLYVLHDELLASAGSSWDDYRPIPEGWMTSPKADEFRQRLRETVGAEYGRSGFFIVKDPRICRLVPIWRELLDEMQVTPLFVHTHRNPMEVATSLHKRNGFDLEYGCVVWLRHVLDAEHGSRGQVRSFTSYDHLLENWPGETARIASDLGISWPRYSAFQASELNSIIEPELKRNVAGVGSLRGSRMVSRWLDEVHVIFERWAAGDQKPDDQQALDDIRHAFNESTSLFQSVVHSRGRGLSAERDEARRKRAEADALIETLTAERDEARKKASEVGALSLERHKAIERVVAERNDARKKIAEAEALGVEQTKAIESLTAERDEARKKASEVSALSLERHKAIERVVAERDDARKKIAQAEALRVEQTKAIEILTTERDEAHKKVVDLGSQTAERQEVIETLHAERDALVEQNRLDRSKLAQSKAELDDVWRDLKAAHDALSEAEAQRSTGIQELEQAKGLIEALQTENARRDRELALGQSIILRHQDETAAMRVDRDEARRQAAEAQAHGFAREEAITVLANERDHAQQQTAEAQAQTAARDEVITALIAERDHAQQQTAEAQVQTAARDEVITALVAERDHAQQQTAEAQAQTAARDEVITALVAERDHAQQQTAEAQARYSSTLAELATVKEETDLRNAENSDHVARLDYELRTLREKIKSRIGYKVSRYLWRRYKSFKRK